MRLIIKRFLWVILGILAACQPVVETPAPTPTFTPRFEVQLDFELGQCIKVTRPTYLRFGPGIEYPVSTNIPVRSQPPMHIFDTPITGTTCSDPTQCSLRDEGWWWPVEVDWPDTDDVDQGWLWQADFKAC